MESFVLFSSLFQELFYFYLLLHHLHLHLHLPFHLQLIWISYLLHFRCIEVTASPQTSPEAPDEFEVTTETFPEQRKSTRQGATGAKAKAAVDNKRKHGIDDPEVVEEVEEQLLATKRGKMAKNSEVNVLEMVTPLFFSPPPPPTYTKELKS